MLAQRHTMTVALLSLLAIGAVIYREDARPAPEPEQTAEQDHTHAYSPFAVRVSGHAAFEVVTFKRVGVAVPQSTDESYEEVAESLALALEQRSQSKLMTEVLYTPELLEPDSHVFCDTQHLYVDFWSTEPGWGYSLWSGCGDNDRFAWTEFPVASGDPVEALTAHILDTLDSADRASCYQREC